MDVNQMMALLGGNQTGRKVRKDKKAKLLAFKIRVAKRRIKNKMAAKSRRINRPKK